MDITGKSAVLLVLVLWQIKPTTPFTPVDWSFWVEKALSIGVLIWVIIDMKKVRNKTQKHHKEEMLAQKENYEMIIRMQYETYKKILDDLKKMYVYGEKGR